MNVITTELQKSASKLVDLFGFTMTLVRASGETYDSATGVVTETTSNNDITAVIVKYRSSDIDGVSILRDDRMLYVKANAVSPEEGDIVTFRNESVKIVSVHTIFRNNTYPLVHICQVRG